MGPETTPADPGLAPEGDAREDPRDGVGDTLGGVEPLDVDGTRTVLVGTLLWAAAFCVLLPFWGRLADAGRLWWLWTCAAGFGLGVVGWEHCRRRARRRLGRPGRD